MSYNKPTMGTRVYVGRLNYDVRERDLEKFFKGYGRIREILLKNGFGFVEFDDYRDADDAVYELNGKELLGERVNVQHARGGGPRSGGGGGGGGPRGSGGGRGWGGGGGYGRNNSSRDNYRSSSNRDQGGGKDKRYGPPTRTDHRLIVENLSSRISWQDLKDYMRQAGEVTYADAHKQHRNEGVVEFASHADIKNAIEKLNGTELNGRKIKLFEDKSHRRSRSRSSRRSRSRSRSRSARSRSRSRSKSTSRSRSKSRSPRSKSRSKSKSPVQRVKNESRSRSKSRSKSKEAKSDSKSRSRSKSPEINGDRSSDKEMDDKKDD